MSEERRPGDDVREGLGLLLRAATTVATSVAKEVAGATKDATKEVDWRKITRDVGRAAEEAGREIFRLANRFGQNLEDDIGVTSKSAPPPSAEAPPSAESHLKVEHEVPPAEPGSSGTSSSGS